MTTRKPSCNWVRARLPLEIDPDDGDFGDEPRQAAGSGDHGRARVEGSGLDAAERERIARHLADCPPCRRHRAEQLDAIAILSAVSAISPVEPHAPSLWPALELRIREQEERARAKLSRPRPVLSRLASLLPGGDLDPDPIGPRQRLLRGRDAAMELIDRLVDYSRDLLPERRIRLRPGVAFGGLMAALACGVIALEVDRDQARSRIEIAQSARPIVASPVPAAGISANPADSELESETETETDVVAEDGGDRWLWDSSSRTMTSSDDDGSRGSSRSGLPGALAQADILPRSRQSSGSTGGLGIGNGAANAASASTSSSKYDFDLERGTPMAPDSRDAKPAY